MERNILGFSPDSDPRYDIFNIATEMKTKQLGYEKAIGTAYSKKSTIHIGDATITVPAIRNESITKEQEALFHTIIATYRIFVKIRNLMVIFATREYNKGTSFLNSPIKFKEIDLFLLLKIKELWNEISKEVDRYLGLSETVSNKIKLHITKKSDSTILYDANLKLGKLKEGDIFLEKLPWAELYTHKINLMTHVTKRGNNSFRRLLFGLLRYADLEWRQDVETKSNATSKWNGIQPMY